MSGVNSEEKIWPYIERELKGEQVAGNDHVSRTAARSDHPPDLLVPCIRGVQFDKPGHLRLAVALGELGIEATDYPDGIHALQH